MNVERLNALAKRLVSIQNATRVKKRLGQFAAALQEVANGPDQADRQNTLVSQRNDLNNVLHSPELNTFSDGELRMMESIGVAPFIGNRLANRIDEILVEERITPAVASQRVAQLVADYDKAMGALSNIVEGLKNLNIPDERLKPGEAEIGFLLPHTLYHDNLKDLSKELATLNKALKILAEALTGHSQEDIRIADISASEPTFFLGLGWTEIKLIGDLVKWGLETLKQIMELAKLAKDLREKSVDFDGDVLDSVDSQVEKAADKALDAKAKEIVDNSPVKDKGRRNELQKGVRTALADVVGRLERGMIIEIRALPPAEVPGAEMTPAYEQTVQEAILIAEIVRQLRFPAPAQQPVIRLPGLDVEK